MLEGKLGAYELIEGNFLSELLHQYRIQKCYKFTHHTSCPSYNIVVFLLYTECDVPILEIEGIENLLALLMLGANNYNDLFSRHPQLCKITDLATRSKIEVFRYLMHIAKIAIIIKGADQNTF